MSTIAKDLMIGNWVEHKPEWSYRNNDCKSFYFQWNERDWYGLGECTISIDNILPIKLTPDILVKCGFEQLPHFTVQNTFFKKLGRDRVLSIACVGTPNEMVFITEEIPPEVKNIIVVRNYDYDGKTNLHELQQLYKAITKTELKITLP